MHFPKLTVVLSFGSIIALTAKETMACSPSSEAIPFYRAYAAGTAGDHFYTTSDNEYNNAVVNLGYAPEGISSRIFPTNSDGTVPLYRLNSRSQVDHFYTTAAAEVTNSNGYALEGIAGYVYPSSACGAVPLYRLYSSTSKDHFYTTSVSERDNAANKLGFRYEGVAAYVINA